MDDDTIHKPEKALSALTKPGSLAQPDVQMRWTDKNYRLGNVFWIIKLPIFSHLCRTRSVAPGPGNSLTTQSVQFETVNVLSLVRDCVVFCGGETRFGECWHPKGEKGWTELFNQKFPSNPEKLFPAFHLKQNKQNIKRQSRLHNVMWRHKEEKERKSKQNHKSLEIFHRSLLSTVGCTVESGFKGFLLRHFSCLMMILKAFTPSLRPKLIH